MDLCSWFGFAFSCSLLIFKLPLSRKLFFASCMVVEVTRLRRANSNTPSKQSRLFTIAIWQKKPGAFLDEQIKHMVVCNGLQIQTLGTLPNKSQTPLDNTHTHTHSPNHIISGNGQHGQEGLLQFRVYFESFQRCRTLGLAQRLHSTQEWASDLYLATLTLRRGLDKSWEAVEFGVIPRTIRTHLPLPTFLLMRVPISSLSKAPRH